MQIWEEAGEQEEQRGIGECSGRSGGSDKGEEEEE